MKISYIVSVFIACLALLCCTNQSKIKSEKFRNSYVAIFRIRPSHLSGSIITAIALINNKVYYFKDDSLLMTYKRLPTKNAQVINDSLSAIFLQSLRLPDIKMMNARNCNCKSLSENKLIIDTNQDRTREYIVDEDSDCDISSPCKSIEKITSIFLKFDKW